MVSTTSKTLSLEEFIQLPETTPASEFVEGYIYQKPMPQGKHSRLQLKLCNAINDVVEDGKVALAFPELRCTFGERSMVPDVVVLRWERIPFDAEGEIENRFETHPDWMIEILSPEQASTRSVRNILHGLRYGTQLGWLIDPTERFILVFQAEQQPVELMGENSLIIPDFLELNLTVNQVFDWLKPGKQNS
ncbi:Uma2 family endonuclease [Lyngbya sp. PCC 8106]|uniref:Uma2 family endonuclease n=1 Tax=Lyngbya sp. (strain PCC 8106) TaxID=313612 RepID=UPI0000EACDD0|nr:Uma2 family endonuclease [Lyngbya sp. PCC 8106]EAW35463.1 hypothetical protein L8106_10347 [Lyngbya sp. PCC 8106]